MTGMSKSVVQEAIEQGLFDAPPHAAVIYDLDCMKDRIGALHAAFPRETLHTLAIKACPLTKLLQRAVELGCGTEAASAVELEQALRVGAPPENIVFDSPVKTVAELRRALSAGVQINADNLQELERIAGLVASGPAPIPVSVGIRVNPEIASGDIEATSTAIPGSKFGVSLRKHSRDLVECFARYPWLNGLHVHVGSQGCDVSLLTAGVARTVEFAGEIERRCGSGRISTFDLGGGLPVAYRAGERAPSFADYADTLRRNVPSLFSRDWRLITEFGRAVWAAAGCVVSRVEYTKESSGRRIAVVHVGADLFLRAAYMPEKWYHELSVYDASGRAKESDPIEQDVAGPLCFSGDLIARGRRLPLIEPGDHVVVHDAGAYTLSMWSRYNSRLSPAVYGHSNDRNGLELLRRGERVFDLLGFWD